MAVVAPVAALTSNNESPRPCLNPPFDLETPILSERLRVRVPANLSRDARGARLSGNGSAMWQRRVAEAEGIAEAEATMSAGTSVVSVLASMASLTRFRKNKTA